MTINPNDFCLGQWLVEYDAGDNAFGCMPKGGNVAIWVIQRPEQKPNAWTMHMVIRYYEDDKLYPESKDQRTGKTFIHPNKTASQMIQMIQGYCETLAKTTGAREIQHLDLQCSGSEMLERITKHPPPGVYLRPL